MRTTPAAAPPAPADLALESQIGPPPSGSPGFHKALDKARTATAEGQSHKEKKQALTDESAADTAAAASVALAHGTDRARRDDATKGDADGTTDSTTSQTSADAQGPGATPMTDEPAPVEGRLPAAPSVLPAADALAQAAAANANGVAHRATPAVPAHGGQPATPAVPAQKAGAAVQPGIATDPAAAAQPGDAATSGAAGTQAPPQQPGVATDPAATAAQPDVATDAKAPATGAAASGQPGVATDAKAPATGAAASGQAGAADRTHEPKHAVTDAVSGPATGDARGTGTVTAPRPPAHHVGAPAGGAASGPGAADAASQGTVSAPSGAQATQQAQPAAATQPAATPATSAAPARPEPTPAVELGATIERLHDVLHLTRSRGAAHAHLELHPRDLGAVDVRLRTTQDGVIATIKVHEQAALSTVTAAGQDLRDALQQRGITVARLDVSLAGDQGDRSGESRREQPARRRVGAIGLDDDLSADATSDTPTHVASSLVDVHA